MKILLVGRNGQLAWELQRTLNVLGEVFVAGAAEMNLADPDAIVRVTGALRPDLIVNAAAYTAVDRAESERELALAINAVAPGVLAAEAVRLGAALVHFSTDYVFDGEQDAPYGESDPPHPLNVYGASKLAGELAVQQAGCPHLILRTSWLYGARGSNFVLTMLRLLQERPEVAVVADQSGVPCWSRWLAEATAFLLAARHPRELPRQEAVYHVTPAGEVSWHGLACAIRELMQCPGNVSAIAAADYPSAARRPRNSVLSGARVEGDFGLHRPHWRELLELCLAELRR
ncbi:MAG: dTDP-4-dehydrorhamnose reductase [Moraxellaceae bacterium]|nr:dTDP-4-dehydrorhamnose reductase [Moraxellaceae bacterium]